MRSVRSTIAVSAALVLSGAAAGTAHAATAPQQASASVAQAALPLASGSSAGAKAPASTTAPKGLFAPSALVLVISKGEEPKTSAVQRAVTLSCEPRAMGTHPSPRAACRELTAVNGDFNALPSTLAGVLCTRQYDPVAVTAHGVWRGVRVDWTASFNNACEMGASLGGGALYAF
ncbi:subtilase-type protease inhibitor [Streptomyces clavuligerus]|uniref:Protease inhibitor protein n=1 Tax=Streptomyces clavuligerus TaxID=1901 RepID=E2Q070_STRCL|nr:subtilase-type protease inhibitor [Streptomyces clavuligerus]EFG08489.1 protease inhibitor protein [Streptomyces clavuligerus]MBY6303352.1 subtilase-type protease inhibitor [Streptomyces clavuligerus]QCS06177.1 serine protease [Streptomyces clavuligerus]QPJ94464.1 serine protease [Streptomyces clavuligerus]WDN53316.1 subtilase-type protease inhibitor [Streptomyces clavuligerus]